MEATLRSKGRATIPKAVREHLHLSPGDLLKFSFLEDGHVVMSPARASAAPETQVNSCADTSL